jgi:hypothetical protein
MNIDDLDDIQSARATEVLINPRYSSAWRRNITRRLLGTVAEEEVFHLPSQILPGALIGQIQAIFVDQHGLVFHPELPSLLADRVVDFLAKFAGVRRVIQPFGLFFEVDALNDAGHLNLLEVELPAGFDSRLRIAPLSRVS